VVNLPPYEQLPRRTRRTLVARALVRALVTSVLLVTAYYALPFDHITGAGQITVLVLGIAALAVLIGWQVRAILHAPYPVAQAIESLAFTTPLFLLLFASTYYLLGHTTPSDFTQRMTRTDALYFTITTFTTTGFGDIAATSEGARLIVTGQMLLDLILLGFGVRVLVGAVRIGQEARRGGGERPDPTAS
jgi:voltage-gated potassium channel